MKTKRNLMLAMAAALLPYAGSSASATLIGASGQLTSLDRTAGGYWKDNGGEFTIKGTSPALDLSSYVASTRLTSTGFQTFCLETDEYTFSGSGNYVVNDRAVNGGSNIPGVGFDVLSKGTTWLYSQFASGVLSGYTYTAGTGRVTSAGNLQNAIWMLEGEISWVSTNPFIVLASQAAALGGSGVTPLTEAALKVNALTAEFGVYALNINDNSPVALGQDQLYYNPNGERTPDGGTTIMLLGVALGGISFVRRFVKA